MTPPLNVPFNPVGNLLEPAHFSNTLAPRKEYASDPSEAFHGVFGKALASQKNTPFNTERPGIKNRPDSPEKNQKIDAEPSTEAGPKTAEVNDQSEEKRSVDTAQENNISPTDENSNQTALVEAALLTQPQPITDLTGSGSLAILPPPLPEGQALATENTASSSVQEISTGNTGLPKLPEIQTNSVQAPSGALAQDFGQALPTIQNTLETALPGATPEGETAPASDTNTPLEEAFTPLSTVNSDQSEAIPIETSHQSSDRLAAAVALNTQSLPIETIQNGSPESNTPTEQPSAIEVTVLPQAAQNQQAFGDTSENPTLTTNTGTAGSLQANKSVTGAGGDKPAIFEALLNSIHGEGSSSEISEDPDTALAETTLSDPALSLQNINALGLPSKGTEALGPTGRASGNVLPQFEGTVVDQVVQGASLSMQNGRKELTLQLNPENLGQLRIHLSTLGNNQISARLIADNAQTHKQLQTQMDSLKTALESQGLQVQRITVVHAGSDMNTGNQDQTFADTRQNQFQQLAHQQASQHYQSDTSGHRQGARTSHTHGSTENTSAEIEAVGETQSTRSPALNNPNGRVSLLI